MKRFRHILYLKIFFFLLYLLFIGGLVCTHGITDNLEAEKYINAARDIISGEFHSVLINNTPFISYIFFLIPATIGGMVQISIIPQITLSIIAGNEIFTLLHQELKNIRLAFLGMIAFLFNYFIQFWTTTLFSESFFISMSTIFIVQTIRKDINRKHFLFILALAVIITFARPQGILFVLPGLFYFVKKYNNLSPRAVNIIFSISLAAVFYFILKQRVSCAYVFKPIAESDIICGFSETKELSQTPAVCNIWEAHRLLIREYGLLHDLRLFGNKLISLFTFTRPYYSLIHNLVIALNYIFLFLGLIPLISVIKKKNDLLLYTIILLNCVLVGLTYDEWHGRYLAVLTPALIILSMQGCDMFLRIIVNKYRRSRT